jgi:hypothetical protein
MLNPSDDIAGMAEDVLSAVVRFFHSVSEFRASVEEAVSEAVNDEALNTFMMETVSELDELSTHTQIDEVVADDVKVKSINASTILLMVSGTVYVELIYGSSSDQRRGDGARMNGHYPFSMVISAPTDDISELRSLEFSVDNSAFYE